jgi:hypothetical protein
MVKIHYYLRWSRTNPFVNIVFDNRWIIGHTQYLKHSIAILSTVLLFLDYKNNTLSLNGLKCTREIIRRNLLQNVNKKLTAELQQTVYVIQIQ